MSAPVLIVEQRLRVVLVYLDALRQLALLVDEPVHVPQFETPEEFAKWVASMAHATAAHVACRTRRTPCRMHESRRATDWRCAMTPQTAARRVVAAVLRGTFCDVLDLSERDAAGYERVEAAVRRAHRIRPCNVEALEKAVCRAVPETHRAAVARALSKLCKARDEELTAKQQTAFVIGIEVGRSLVAKAGEL